jgi:ribokinase
MSHDVVILGVFMADTTHRANRLPRMGETIRGTSFSLGPGGKGSNQAVAAAKAGADVGFISRLGKDAFADMALKLWAEAGVTPLVTQHADQPTGSAFIFVDDATGDNAIIISPGVAETISAADLDAQIQTIASARVLVTQLEQPLDAAQKALGLARDAGVATILNPAPAADIPDALLTLCDYVTPNETEAGALSGVEVTDLSSATSAARRILSRGVAKACILTLGAHGCVWCDPETEFHVPAMEAGPLVETTGAGDAFNGGLAVALAEGMPPRDAMRFATATAALSVTRAGAASSMPTRSDIDALLARV